MKDTKKPRRRVRLLLLVLLWVWAALVFVTIDLFRNVTEFDAIRPRSPLYTSLREAGHELTGEPILDGASPPMPAARAAQEGEEGAGSAALVSIGGFVYTPEGAPAAAARVVARDRAASAFYRTATGEDGSFMIDVPSGRAYDVFAASPAGAPTFRFGVLPPFHIDLVLNEGGRIAGRAVDRRTGAGIPGVALAVSPGSQSTGDPPELDALLEVVEFSATTDAEGSYAFDGVPPGEWSVNVVGGRGGGFVNLPGPGAVRCDIPMEPVPPTTLLGRVCDKESGDPIEGAVVSARGGSARTDESGVFRLEASPGWARLDVVAEGRPPVEARVRVGDARTPVEVRIPRYVSVVGTVLGPDDRPVAGVAVRWIGREGPSPEQVTGEDGTFVIGGIAPDDPGFAQAHARGFVTAEASPEAGRIVLRLEAGARIEGRVLGSDGRPAAGVPVVLLPGGWIAEESEDDMGIAERRVTRTDALGCYAIEDLPTGGAWIFAVPVDPELAPVGTRVVAPGAAPDLALGRGRSVKGEVLDPEGRPLAGATVRLVSELRGGEATTGARGEFVLKGLPAIDESIVVTLKGHAPSWADLPADPTEPVKVTMRPLAAR